MYIIEYIVSSIIVVISLCNSFIYDIFNTVDNIVIFINIALIISSCLLFFVPIYAIFNIVNKLKIICGIIIVEDVNIVILNTETIIVRYLHSSFSSVVFSNRFPNKNRTDSIIKTISIFIFICRSINEIDVTIPI